MSTRLDRSKTGRSHPAAEDVVIRLDPPAPPKPRAVLSTGEPIKDARRSARAVYRLVGIGLSATDALCLSAALLLAYWVRYGTWFPDGYVGIGLVAIGLWMVVFRSFGLHAPDRLSPAEEFRRVFNASSVGLTLLVLTIFWSHTEFSRIWVAVAWVLSVVFELLARQIWRKYQYKLRVNGKLSLRTLIIGTNDEAGKLAHVLNKKGSGFAPLGYVVASGPLTSPDGLAVIGHLDDLRATIRSGAVDCLFVASTGINPDEMLAVSQAARQEKVSVRVSANLPQVLASRISVQPIGQTMAISLKPVHLTRTQIVLKRTFDLTAAGLLSILMLPVVGAIAIAVRLTSPGPVIFKQRRVTKGGRVFQMYKFRTMNDGAELPSDEIDPSAPFFKIIDDPRITRVGRYLRRWSLDELPQMWNVVKGDLSLVGPRPLPAEQVAANLTLLDPRHDVSAGVTGWWQISGRSTLSPQDALHLDLFYIENWSLAFDLYILMKTFGAIVARKGAY